MLLVKPMSIKLVLEPVPVLMFRVIGPVAGAMERLVSVPWAMETLRVIMPVTGTMTIIPMWFTVMAIKMFFVTSMVMFVFVKIFIVIAFSVIAMTFSPKSVCP